MEERERRRERRNGRKFTAGFNTRTKKFIREINRPCINGQKLCAERLKDRTLTTNSQ